MLVKDVMNKNVVIAKPETTLKEAAKVMGEMNIGSLIIVENDRILGIITSTDVMKAVGEGKDPDSTFVRDIMSKNVITIHANEALSKAVELIVKHKIKRLPVMIGEKLVGIITVSDIAIVEPKIVASISSLISLRAPKYTGA